MEIPADRRYHQEHTWVLVDGEEGTIGVTDLAQRQLGDVVYVEVPAIGEQIAQGRPFGVIESAKAVSDLHAPVSGEVIARHEELEDEPEIVNESPNQRGWIIRVRLSDAAELDKLLDAEAYVAQLPAEDGDE